MNNRDLELLSAYLDGQLTPSESARLESRLAADPELSTMLADLRATRSLLRKLPQRKAPRNFTLTRKMVGLNPPLPRSYSFFKFSTAFASLLLMLTFAANFIVPRISYIGIANASGGGGGFGGAAVEQQAPMFAQPAATQAPATQAAEAMAATAAPATQAPAAAAATQVPAATEAPLEIMPTATAEAARAMPTAEALAQKQSPTLSDNSAPQTQPVEEIPAPISIGWQIGILAVVIISVVALFIMRQSAKSKWQ